MQDFIEKLHLGDEGRGLSFIGYSFGAGLILSHVAAHPEKVSKICLVSPFLWGDTATDEAAAAVVSKVDHMMAMRSPADLTKKFTHFMGIYPEQLPPAFFQRALISKLHIVSETYWPEVGYNINSRPDAQRRLAQITPKLQCLQAPCLILIGERDNMVAPSKIMKLKEIMSSNCSVHSLPDCGHIGGPRGATFPKTTVLTLSAPVAIAFFATK